MNANTSDHEVFRQGEMVTLTVDPSGKLVIHPTQAFEDQIAEIVDQYEEHGEEYMLRVLFQDITENQDPEFIAPHEIGALTSAPIFVDSIQRDDHGKVTEVGRIWWHERYQIESIVEELIDGRPAYLEPATGAWS